MEFFDDPDSTREEILGAAYRALGRHGYADLTVEKIGAEFDKSPSLVYHHYDGKDELLLACLEYMLESYEAQLVEGAVEDPRGRLEAAVEAVLDPEPDGARDRFTRALVELRAQAAHDERYRDHFTRSDRFFHSRLVTVVEAGAEAGEFREVDPEAVAATIGTFFAGWFLRRATVDDDERLRDARDEFEAFLHTRLYADGDEA